jgi:hypothetical protein
MRWPLLFVALATACGGNKILPVAPVTTPDAAAPPAVAASPGDAPFVFTSVDAALSDAEPAATCAAEVHQAQPIALDLVFVVDQSPSMLFQIGGRTKWDLAREAVQAFLKDPRSAGLGVGLQIFPRPSANDQPCASDEECGYLFACAGAPKTCSAYPFKPFPSCDWREYQSLAVPIAELPGAQPRLATTLAALNPSPNAGVSNMGTAAQGVFASLRARLKTEPGRRSALVLVTDGVPSGCFFGWLRTADVEKGLAAEAAQTPAIPTYVIGIFSADRQEDAEGPAALQRFATAGGTAAPFLVKPPDDVVGKLGDALDQIRQATLPCDFTIPPAQNGAALDYDKVNLHVSARTGPEDVPYVGSAARCDATRGGWYYDADPATGGKPTRVTACAATCRRFKTEAATQVSLTFGCATVVIQ